MTRAAVTALVLLTLALSLAACGKKNDPEPLGGPTTGYGHPYPNPKTISQ